LELGFGTFFRVDLSYFRQPNGTLMAKEFNKKKVVFAGVDTDKTYTVLVTLGKFLAKEFNKKKVVFTGVDTDRTYIVLVTLGKFLAGKNTCFIEDNPEIHLS
jgi:uncharacterized membrane protein